MSNSLLQIIADNQNLLDELKSLFVAEFDIDYTTSLDVNKSNEDLGALLRARLEGLRRIDNAFKKISQHKVLPKNVENKMPGR